MTIGAMPPEPTWIVPAISPSLIGTALPSTDHLVLSEEAGLGSVLLDELLVQHDRERQIADAELAHDVHLGSPLRALGRPTTPAMRPVPM